MARKSIVIACFLAIYFLWGSTYLAVVFGLQSIPPLMLMGLRSVAGGIILFAIGWRGVGDISASAWASAVACGVLFFLGCHGILAYAQQTGAGADRDRAEANEQQALHERDRAVQAQASSRQISEFLVSVFNGSHPDAGSGEIPTSKLVEQSLQRIDSELKGQPATQAELYATLAGVQRVLGNAEQARTHFDKAIALQRTLDDPLVLAGMLSKRALLSRASFAREGAVADAREALALTEQHAAADSAAVAAAAGLLGRTLSDDSQHALAEPWSSRLSDDIAFSLSV